MASASASSSSACEACSEQAATCGQGEPFSTFRSPNSAPASPTCSGGVLHASCSLSGEGSSKGAGLRLEGNEENLKMLVSGFCEAVERSPDAQPDEDNTAVPDAQEKADDDAARAAKLLQQEGKYDAWAPFLRGMLPERGSSMLLGQIQFDVTPEDQRGSWLVPEEVLALQKEPAVEEHSDRQVFTNTPVSEEEQQAIDEILVQLLELQEREEAENLGPDALRGVEPAWLEQLILRYLHSCSFDKQKTFELLQSTLEFRTQQLPLLESEVYSELRNLGACYWHGRDRKMRPLLVLSLQRLQQLQREDGMEEKVSRMIVFCLEFFLRYLCVAGVVESWCILCDLNGISITSFPLPLLVKLIRLIQGAYRGRLHRFYILHAPRLFQFVARPLLSSLPASTARKIQVYTEAHEWEQERRIQFAGHQLEQKFGGTAPDLTENWYPFHFFPGPFDPDASYDAANVDSIAVRWESEKSLHEKVHPSVHVGVSLHTSLLLMNRTNEQNVDGDRPQSSTVRYAAWLHHLPELNLAPKTVQWARELLQHRLQQHHQRLLQLLGDASTEGKAVVPSVVAPTVSGAAEQESTGAAVAATVDEFEGSIPQDEGVERVVDATETVNPLDKSVDMTSPGPAFSGASTEMTAAAASTGDVEPSSPSCSSSSDTAHLPSLAVPSAVSSLSLTCAPCVSFQEQMSSLSESHLKASEKRFPDDLQVDVFISPEEADRISTGCDYVDFPETIMSQQAATSPISGEVHSSAGVVEDSSMVCQPPTAQSNNVHEAPHAQQAPSSTVDQVTTDAVLSQPTNSEESETEVEQTCLAGAESEAADCFFQPHDERCVASVEDSSVCSNGPQSTTSDAELCGLPSWRKISSTGDKQEGAVVTESSGAERNGQKDQTWDGAQGMQAGACGACWLGSAKERQEDTREDKLPVLRRLESPVECVRFRRNLSSPSSSHGGNKFLGAVGNSSSAAVRLNWQLEGAVTTPSEVRVDKSWIPGSPTSNHPETTEADSFGDKSGRGHRMQFSADRRRVYGMASTKSRTLATLSNRQLSVTARGRTRDSKSTDQKVLRLPQKGMLSHPVPPSSEGFLGELESSVSQQSSVLNDLVSQTPKRRPFAATNGISMHSGHVNRVRSVVQQFPSEPPRLSRCVAPVGRQALHTRSLQLTKRQESRRLGGRLTRSEDNLAKTNELGHHGGSLRQQNRTARRQTRTTTNTPRSSSKGSIGGLLPLLFFAIATTPLTLSAGENAALTVPKAVIQSWRPPLFPEVSQPPHCVSGTRGEALSGLPHFPDAPANAAEDDLKAYEGAWLPLLKRGGHFHKRPCFVTATAACWGYPSCQSVQRQPTVQPTLRVVEDDRSVKARQASVPSSVLGAEHRPLHHQHLDRASKLSRSSLSVGLEMRRAVRVAAVKPKSRGSIDKRFKVTSTGKLLYKRPGLQHHAHTKSASRRTRLRHTATLKPSQISRLLGPFRTNP